MFTSTTPETEKEMLDTIGVSSVKELLAQIPEQFLYPALNLPKALTEAELTAHIRALAAKNKPLKNFIGSAGSFFARGIFNRLHALSGRG